VEKKGKRMPGKYIRRKTMENDEVHLRLTIDVHYELGRTDVRDLERVLIAAADRLAGEGLLSGETEASVLTWDSAVITPNAGGQQQMKRSEMQSVEPSCSPFWHAVGGFFATPLLVVTLLLSAIVFLIVWPLIPVLLYFQRQEEISKANNQARFRSEAE
jgi:hypothetical protein